MKMKPFSSLPAAISVWVMISCNSGTPGTHGAAVDSTVTTKDSAMTTVNIREENVTISADTTNMQCFVAYADSRKDRRPIVLVLPEWWGLNDYPRSRAKQLAALGYFALAVDIYGNGSIGTTPDQAKVLAGGFYNNPELAAGRIQAALARAKTYAQADGTKTAAIGYCFGGSMVLNAAKLGAPLDAVVSFHGGLAGVAPKKNTIKSKILVCNGMADASVTPEQVDNFRKQLDSAGVQYSFIEYPNATHAFTNPASDDNAAKFHLPIAYNPEADKKSWEDMKTFFATVWK